MPITLHTLVRDQSLHLQVRAGAANLGREVGWAHSSELIDPTPFLEGGELLLTTGLGLREGEFGEYVRRVAEQGVAGVGFGVGLGHDEIPADLVDTAKELALPLLEVPHPTPFIAISKAVSRALAADEYAAVARTNAAQQELTRAAVSGPGFENLLRRLARLTGAWVVLLDRSGEVLQARPAKAAGRGSALQAELSRLRTRKGPMSAHFTIDGDAVSLQSLGTATQGFLAVGRTEPLSPWDQHIVNTAASLLTLGLAQSEELDLARRHLRTGLFHLLEAGHVDLVRGSVREVDDALPEPPLRVCAITGSPRSISAAVDLIEVEAGTFTEPVFAAEVDGAIVLLANAASDAAAWLSMLVGSLHGLRIGVSAEVDEDAVRVGHRQARRAAEHAARTQRDLVHFSDLTGDGLLELLAGEQPRAFAESLLLPLLRHDASGRGDLVASLREWLTEHGQWDPAAARLGVHRHTLRNRMRKVEDLTGRSLDSPGFRAELWVALQLLDVA
jgi:purine catabolism regulator